MNGKNIVLALAFILALAPAIASAEPADYLVDADGFTVSISSEHPAISFYHGNSTEPVFSISYDRLILYGSDISSPVFFSNLSSSLWETTIHNSTEEDGTVRTVVSMSSMIDLSGISDVKDWARLSFNFLILANGDKAQLGISMTLSDIKPVNSCSNLAIVQSIDGDATFIPESNEVIISDIYYRWDPTAKVNLGGTQEDRDVSATYSDGSLSMIYPYSRNTVEIMHISGRMDLGSTVVMRDYFSDALGYGLGMLAGFGILGMTYAVKGKKKKSPFDMNSPIYRK